MTKKELQQIRSVVKEHTDPIMGFISRHETALFGLNGDQGLYKDVKELKESAAALGLFKKEVYVWATAIATGAGIIFAVGKEVIRSFLPK